GKLIDFGVARLTSPHKTTPGERIEQINKTLETQALQEGFDLTPGPGTAIAK
ncbi:unnamed protein product, partial [marine sediment metagenome]